MPDLVLPKFAKEYFAMSVGEPQRIKTHRPPDQDIIDAHSTPGLRRNELTRSAKRAQLIETQKGMTMDEREALLDKLYSSPSPNA